MKYRIVKITPTEDKPYYTVQVRSSIFSSWAEMSKNGYPMIMGIYSMSQERVFPFESLELARKCLDGIVNYKPPTKEIVFET